MSAEAAAFVRTWAVGKYTCTLTMPKPRPGRTMHVAIEWAPEQPKRLTQAEIDEYREGRNDAIRSLGLNALVLDL